ncbi:MAG TPA: substrate-binding domain-containing protein [Bacteroidota bacterium]|nr:substrate-binding domain-containing protein [Bacteroidota bacterium]
MKRIFVLFGLLLALEGCGGKEPGSVSITSGSFRLGCDEAVLPVINHEVQEFTRLYTGASVAVQSGQAREIIAAFAADSLKTIVCARELNREERDALTAAKVPMQEYLLARSAVAVVANPGVPVKELRIGQLDTIFSGGITRWPGNRALMIELAVGGVNSSVNEVFRKTVLGNGGFDPSAKPFSSGAQLLDFVKRTHGAVGIIGLNELGASYDGLSVLAISSPAMRPDSTYAPDEYYAPIQGYVYTGYYPVLASVYVYTRDIEQDVSMGFIAFMTSFAGQKIIQTDGLAPETMPVRVVHLKPQQTD